MALGWHKWQEEDWGKRHVA
ncbi:hypothetical protein [Salmonella enterica]